MSIKDQMHIIGIVLGWIIVVGYLWAVMNYFIKLINRKAIDRLPRNSAFRARYSTFMHAVVSSHVYVPLFLLTILILHFLMELIHVGLFSIGVITIGLMAVQITLGIYGVYIKKKRRGNWFYIHRAVAALLFAAIAAHVATLAI